MRADSVAGGVGFVFSLAYLAIALQITSSSLSATVVGPRTFPVVIGVALALASLALLVKGLREDASSEEGDETAESVEEEDDTLAQSPVRLGVIIALLVGYLLLFIPLGYLVSTSLFVLAVTMYLDSRHRIRNLVYAIVFPLVVYFVFTELLQVTLPTGLLG